MHILNVIRRPIASEKTEMLRTRNIYTFEVSTNANKRRVSDAIYAIYGVRPIKVNITYKRRRKKRNRIGYGTTSLKKKAYVFFDQKTEIKIFESV